MVLVTNVAMSKFWGAMRGMQMVTYPSLTMTPYPPNALFFYAIVISFANVDIMGDFLGENVYSRMGLVKTEPFN